MNEQCWFIRGIQVHSHFIGILKYHSEGSPEHVSFDWTKATGSKTLGFYHSHPSGVINPSPRDDRTMKAWVISEGRSFICGIFCDGKARTFLYRKNSKKSFERIKLKSIVIGNLIWAYEGKK